MNGCVFCGIAAGKIGATKVYEDGDSMAFLDANPMSPGHTLVVPRSHHVTILDMTETEAGRLFETVRRVVGMVRQGTGCQGLSIQQNSGREAGQEVRHVHFHIVPKYSAGRVAGPGSALHPRKVDSIPAQEIAEAIRAALPKKQKRKSERVDVSFDFGDDAGDIYEL